MDHHSWDIIRAVYLSKWQHRLWPGTGSELWVKPLGDGKRTAVLLGLGHFVLPFIRFIPDSLTYSVPLLLKRQCDWTLGSPPQPERRQRGGPHRELCSSEKDPTLAQKLGQLRPFLAVLPQECVGQLAPFGPT
jgi:hypothetical protein